MDSYWIIGVCVLVVVFIIGQYSTLQKTASKPLRKQGLNDLKETLPRSSKSKHKMPPIEKK